MAKRKNPQKKHKKATETERFQATEDNIYLAINNRAGIHPAYKRYLKGMADGKRKI